MMSICLPAGIPATFKKASTLHPVQQRHRQHHLSFSYALFPLPRDVQLTPPPPLDTLHYPSNGCQSRPHRHDEQMFDHLNLIPTPNVCKDVNTNVSLSQSLAIVCLAPGRAPFSLSPRLFFSPTFPCPADLRGRSPMHVPRPCFSLSSLFPRHL